VAKKAVKMVKAKTPMRSALDETELRRWCIEQAMRWPMRSANFGGQAMYQTPAHEEDVIGRATRLRNWVLATA
jgi:hypothetical protein